MSDVYLVHKDELMHYGVKGMKWGVRRYQNEDGTLTPKGKQKYGGDITKRKTKHVKEQFQSGLRSKTIDVSSVSKKINKEMSKTKESKELNNLNKNMEALFKNAESQGISRDKIVFDKNFADMVNETNNAYMKKYKEIGYKYADEMASISLKSLGYEDTKTGRDWLKKQNFMEW